MPEYRLFRYGLFVHLLHRADCICGNDEEAVEMARSHDQGHYMELWCESRLIRVFGKKWSHE